MKKTLLTLLTVSIFWSANSQNIGINSTGATPDASAMLDIVASNKGLLLPRVTLTGTTDITTIASAATSLLVYNSATVSDVTPGYYYWDSTKWVRLLNVAGGSNDWTITGNGGTTAGTNFIGTTDAVDFVTKTSNTERMRIKSTGNIGIGTTTPSNKVHISESVLNTSRSLLYVESNDPGSGGTISNVAIMGKAYGTGNATDKYVGVLGYTNGGGFGSWRAHGVMGVAGDNAAADWTTYNPYDAPVNATVSGVTGYVTGNVIVQNTAGYFKNDCTSGSTHKGVQVQNYATNGTRYGIYLEVENDGATTTSSRQYGMRMSIKEGTNENYGTRIDLNGNTNSDNWGDYFNITGTGTGISYGSEYILSGGATNYGAKYSISSGTNSYGLYSESTGGASSYGVYAKTSGGTNEYALYADASSNTDYAGYFNTGTVYTKYRLGIGANASVPDESLHIDAGTTSSMILEKDGTGLANIFFHNAGVQSGYLALNANEDILLVNQVSNRNMLFAVNDGGTTTVPLRIVGSTSRVGINTAAPTQNLSVNGTAGKTGGGTWAGFSDKRLKTNIQKFNDGLDILLKINPVKYKYNGLGGISDTESEFIGVIAQEIQKIAPYTIETVSQKLNEGDNINTDLLMYDASALTYILVNAVQELNEKIEVLEKENSKYKDLEKRINALENK